MLKYRWLKFRVTEQEYKDAHHAYVESGERWFWQWCRKRFVMELKSKDENDNSTTKNP